MKKLLIEGLLVGGFAIMAVCFGREAYTLAAASLEQEVTPQPMITPQVVTLHTEAPTPAPVLTPTPRKATPTPSPTPEWAPAVEYNEDEEDDYTHLARYRHSSVPRRATLITQIVACEVVQNRTLNEGFPNRVRRVLQFGGFGGYSWRSPYYKEDAFVADIVMRSWKAAMEGNYDFRYTPRCGVYLCYSEDGRYCKVYDENWTVVCDTSQFE